MRRKLQIYAVAACALAVLAGCKGTWLMYDDGQPDRLYFHEKTWEHNKSFALAPEDTLEVRAAVYVMGSPKDHDRTLRMEYVPLDPAQTQIETGGEVYPLSDAVEGEDYTLEDLVIPAGKVAGTVRIVLHRTAALNGKYKRIGLRLLENDGMIPVAYDSTGTQKVYRPDFYVYMTDGEPACPTWWRYAASYPVGWTVYLGNFTPAKFRRFLGYFHATKETCPTLYEFGVENFGENLEGASANYFRTTFMGLWAKFVFIPLWNWYQDYFAANPDAPDYEPMGDDTVNVLGLQGWANPVSGTYGMLF